MKINFNQNLVNLEGEGLKDQQGKAVTLKLIAVEALLGQMGANGQPENPPADEKMARYIIAKKITKAGSGETELAIEEAAKIKELIGRTFGTIVVGQISDMLDKK